MSLITVAEAVFARRISRAALVVALIAALGGARPGTVRAETSARLPLGSHFAGLAVAPNGQAWVAAVAGQRGKWGLVDPFGQPHWRAYTASREFIGLLSPRSDGGAWMLADDRTVIRADPDGTAGVFAGLTVPFSDNPYTGPSTVATTASDDSLVLAGKLGHFLRVRSDGTAVAQNVSVPAGSDECFPGGIAPAAAGAVVVADVMCSRLLTVTPGGTVTVTDVRPTPPETVRLPAGVLFDPGGTLWFAALVGTDEHLDQAIARVGSDGSVTELAAPGATGAQTAFAAAPDGSVWAALARACAIYRVRDGHVDRLNAPFRVYGLRFAPDGSAWLRGYTRLAHLSSAELNASQRPRTCDTRHPRMGFSAVRRDTLSLRVLRRSGFRVTSSEAATFSGHIRVGADKVRVERVIRKPGGAITVRLPRIVLARAASALDRGRTIDVFINVALYDASGNGVERPGPYRLIP